MNNFWVDIYLYTTRRIYTMSLNQVLPAPLPSLPSHLTTMTGSYDKLVDLPDNDQVNDQVNDQANTQPSELTYYYIHPTFVNSQFVGIDYWKALELFIKMARESLHRFNHNHIRPHSELLDDIERHNDGLEFYLNNHNIDHELTYAEMAAEGIERKSTLLEEHIKKYKSRCC